MNDEKFLRNLFTEMKPVTDKICDVLIDNNASMHYGQLALIYTLALSLAEEAIQEERPPSTKKTTEILEIMTQVIYSIERNS